MFRENCFFAYLIADESLSHFSGEYKGAFVVRPVIADVNSINRITRTFTSFYR